MSLEDIIGQEEITNTLKKSIVKQNVFHAYIFEGPDGMGKKKAAFNFAKAVLCIQPDGDSCGKCTACQKMDNNAHPDYIFIEPDGTSIKDVQIEDMQKNISKKPIEGQNTVVVINKSDSMTVRAQNRLLKTLEEPNAHVIIILLTHNANMLLPTIVSRCMILKFKPVSDSVIKNYLKEKYNISENDAGILTTFCNGRIELAEELYLSDDFKEIRQKSIDMAKKISIFKEEDIWEMISIFEKQKENAIDFLDMIEYWYRDIIILHVSGNNHLIINIDCLNMLIKETKKIGHEKAIKIVRIIEDTKKDLNMNLNFNFVVKNMLLKIQEV